MTAQSFDKIIFLDIDGVLNSKFFDKLRKRDPEYLGFHFCPRASFALNHILKSAPDWFIVISSDWRKHHSLEELKQFMALSGIDSSKVIGVTQISQQGRAKEISLWVKENNVSKFIIIDDTRSHFINELGEFLTLTSEIDGLTMSLADEALELMLK